jgi:hypothetical protein
LTCRGLAVQQVRKCVPHFGKNVQKAQKNKALKMNKK